LEKQYGPLPPTPEVHTGGAGRHLYYSAPAGAKIKKMVLAAGLDLQADGAYVVAPPSRHASGDTYRWAEGRRPDDIPLPPLPGWVNEHATPQPDTDPPTIEELLLAEAGELEPDSPIQDVERWLGKVASVVQTHDLTGRKALLRAAAMVHLKAVKCITTPAQVVDEALKTSARDVPTEE